MIAVILLAIAYVVLGPRIRRWRAAQQEHGHAEKHKTAKRERRVELAAAEAADEDPMFSPDNVRAAGKRLFCEVQEAWSAGDRVKLRGLVAPELLAEWERRLDDFDSRGWHNRVTVIGEPTITYVGLHRTGNANEDRVVVRIDAKLKDYVEDSYGRHLKRSGRLTETVHTREFWTLGKRAGHWILASIEQGGEGEHALETKLVATPWSDDETLHDQAMTEQAVADAVPAGTSVAEIADLDFAGDAHAAALDLSLADGRFAPDLLEIAARRAVEAWAIAIDGDDAALNKVADRAAANAMLYPTPGRRLVVRGPEIEQITITGLDAAADPPTMSIEVKIKGRRYVENRNTAARQWQPLEGSGVHRTLEARARRRRVAAVADRRSWRPRRPGVTAAPTASPAAAPNGVAGRARDGRAGCARTGRDARSRVPRASRGTASPAARTKVPATGTRVIRPVHGLICPR